MWEQMPERDAKTMPLNDVLCSNLNSGIKGARAPLTLLMTVARRSAMIVPPMKV